MDAGFLFKNKEKQVIDTGKKTVQQPWTQEVYREPQQESDFLTKGKHKSANKNVQQEQSLNSSMSLLDEEKMHASQDSTQTEKERRNVLFRLANTNLKGQAVENFTRRTAIEMHENKIEYEDQKKLIKETQEDVRDFMQDPLLERESLKEMANDEKLFNSQAAIAELKTRLEKLKLSLLYMGGTEEQKSKNLLPDESEQALFLAKLHAAHLLFAYREIRLGICSNKYYRDRELSHVMVATSNNGQMMKRMMEVSRQRFLRLLDCAEKLPEKELNDDDIESELAAFDEESVNFEVKDNLDEINGQNAGEEHNDEVQERESDSMVAEAEAEDELKLKREAELEYRRKQEAEIAASEAELEALLDEPVQKDKEAYEEKRRAEIKAAKEEIEKKADAQRLKLEKELAYRRRQEAEIAADEAELEALLNEQTPEEIEAQKKIEALNKSRQKAINDQRRELERQLADKKKREGKVAEKAKTDADVKAVVKAEAEAEDSRLADEIQEDNELADLLKDVKPMSDEEMTEFDRVMENSEAPIESDEAKFEAEESILQFKQALKEAKPLVEDQSNEIKGFDYMPSLEEEKPLHRVQKKVQQPVVEKIPSVLLKNSDNIYSGSIGKVEQKDSDELASEVRRVEVKRQLAEDLAKEKTNSKVLNGIFDMLKEYAKINVTFGDAVTAYKSKGSNFKQTTDDLKNESTLLYNAVSKLSDLSRLINDNADAVKSLDNNAKALVKKYYDRLKDQCFGKLTFDKRYKVHIAKASPDNKLYNGENAETLETAFKNKELLFSHEPCVNDVIQGEFKDCMLLSALTSMVNNDPESIRKMMYDHGDSVTVRFFRQNEQNGGYEPYYINVPKAYTEKNANSALWVRIMETAYSTFRIFSESKNTANMGSWVRKANSIKRLDGQVNLAESPELFDNQNIFANLHWLEYGDTNYETLYSALTGVTCEVNSQIQSDKDYYTKRKTNNMGLYLEQMKSHAGLDKDAYKESNVPKDVNKFKEYITDRIITKLLSVHLFQREDYRDVENPEETLSFFSKKATIEDVQDLLASLGKVTTQLLDKGAKAQEVVKYLKEYRLDSNLGNSLLKELKAFDPSWISFRSDLKKMIADRLALLGKQADKIEDLDHRGFGGEYTDHAIRTFDKIAGALAEGKSLGASTYAFRGAGQEVGPDGQSMVDGIVYGHQYTVIGVAQGEFKNARYIKLRNPWGRYSKEYEVKGDQVISKVKERTSGDPNHGIVYVELNEFMNKFRGYTIAPN